MTVDAAHAAHLAALVLWAIVVAAEAALELSANSDDGRRRVARLHFWIDVTVEIPLLAAVLVTGGALLARAWPPSALVSAKVALALVAVGLNGYCAVHVVLRHARAADPRALAHHGRRVLASGLGVPPALAAAALGAIAIGWWR